LFDLEGDTMPDRVQLLADDLVEGSMKSVVDGEIIEFQLNRNENRVWR